MSELSIIPTREDDHVSALDVHQLEAALPVTEDHDDLGSRWPARNSADRRSGGQPLKMKLENTTSEQAWSVIRSSDGDGPDGGSSESRRFVPSHGLVLR